MYADAVVVNTTRPASSDGSTSGCPCFRRWIQACRYVINADTPIVGIHSPQHQRPPCCGTACSSSGGRGISRLGLWAAGGGDDVLAERRPQSGDLRREHFGELVGSAARRQLH